MIGRRAFLAGAVAVLAMEQAAGGQPAAKVARVAILGPQGPAEVEAFREGLRDLGWVEGQNLVAEARFADRHYERLPSLAEELVRWRPDVIFTYTTPGVLAARHATQTVPVVVAAGELVEKGIVTSLARPGSNITGLTLVGAELDTKRLELLRDILPRLQQVAVLVNPMNPSRPAASEPREKAAQSLGLKLLRIEARREADLEEAFAAMTRARAEALLVTDDAVLGSMRARIAGLAIKHRLSAVSEFAVFAEAGGLLAYGPQLASMFRRAAGFADKILRGARPGDLPIERPDTFTLVVNLKTAKALGLTIPPSVLARADEVIR
jgi:putative tryptophan/tyrosine transport system substrate-binding protein